jgi:uncharacterized membrane protein YhaH (DUF805 family)
MSGLFSMQGRVNRQKYFFTTLLIVAISYGVAFAIGFAVGMAGASEQLAGFLGFLIGVAAAVVQGFLVVKRLHDLGKPGTHYWLMYVPFYNIYLGLVLLFQKGISGSNQYGEDPAAA